MTRNNLQEQLSWLVRNPAVLMPSIHALPDPKSLSIVGPPSSLSSSQSSFQLLPKLEAPIEPTVTVEPTPAPTSRPPSRPSLPSLRPHQHQPPTAPLAPATTGPYANLSKLNSTFHGEGIAIGASPSKLNVNKSNPSSQVGGKGNPESEEQTRMELIQKPKNKKRVFITKEEIPLTPASMRTPGRLTQTSSERLGAEAEARENDSFAGPVHHAVGSLSLAPMEPSKNTRAANAVNCDDFSSDFGDFDDDLLNHVAQADGVKLSLGTNNSQSSKSIEFKPRTLWSQHPERRKESLKKAKKRKSDEISREHTPGGVSDDEQFPDIYEVLGTSPAKAPSTSRIASSPSGNQAHNRNYRLRTEDTCTIVEKNDAALPLIESKSSHVDFDGQDRHPQHIKSNSLKRTSSAVSDGGSILERKTRTPPSSKPSEQATIPDIRPEPKKPKPSRPAIIQDSEDEHESITSPTRHASAPPSTRGKSEDIDVVVETPSKPPPTRPAQMGEHSPRPPDPSSESQFGPDLIQLLVENPKSLLWHLHTIQDSLMRNKSKVGQSIRERWDTARKEAIRAEKARLTREKESIEALEEQFPRFESLYKAREDVIQRIEELWEKDEDIEALDSKVEEIDSQLLVQEKEIKRLLSQAGMTDPSFFRPPPSTKESVVAATQYPLLPDLSRNEHPKYPAPSQEMTVPPQPDSQIIHQTQLPCRPSPTRQTGVSHQTPRTKVLFDVTRIVGSDHESGKLGSSLPENTNDANLPRPRRTPTQRPQPAAADQFSEVDDESLIAMAESFDQEFPDMPPPVAPVSRPILKEKSGNTASAKNQTRVISAKEPVAPSANPKATIPPELMRHKWSNEVKRALKDRFRMCGFRHNQLEAINATLSGKDSFVLMPTGGGKSLCYQLPAVCKMGVTRGVTIVVSPLISLMQDQVEHLEQLGIMAYGFNSELGPSYRAKVLQAFEEEVPENFLQLLYVTPEMINKSTQFIRGLELLHRKKKLARIVIDEAHCVSQWGHDFRPDYKALGEVRAKFPGVPLMALTATATQNVIVDIKHNLGMAGCEVFSQSFNRPNLYYEVLAKEKQYVNAMINLIHSRYSGKTGIVYVLSRKSTEQIAKKLQDAGISAHHYHAAMEASEKSAVQRAWQSGKIKVVVATIAFGMGIDKPDVRFVFHASIPKSLEGYYQETGRAGRDGNPSHCYLYFTYGDLSILRKMIKEGEGNQEQKNRQFEMLNRMVEFAEEREECRRVNILRYFGERFSKEQCEKTCDNCKSGATFTLQDYSQYAKAAIECLRDLGLLTMSQCVDLLLGKNNDKNARRGPYFGAAKGLKRSDVTRVLNKLLAVGALKDTHKVLNRKVGLPIMYLSPSRTANQYVSGKTKLMMVAEVGAKSTRLAVPPSTSMSSPVGTKKRKQVTRSRKVATIISDEEDEYDDVGISHTKHGYAQDGFCVSDNEDENDAFEPIAKTRPRRTLVQSTLTNMEKQSTCTKRNANLGEVESTVLVGPPISQDPRLKEAELPELHRVIIEQFVVEAKNLDEQIRNSKGLRKPLFTESNYREMAIKWTVTPASMMEEIPGIDYDKVDKWGDRFLPLIRQFYQNFCEMSADTTSAMALAELDDDVIEISDDDYQDEIDPAEIETQARDQTRLDESEEEGFSGDDIMDDLDNDTLEEYTDPGQSSRYFDCESSTSSRGTTTQPHSLVDEFSHRPSAAQSQSTAEKWRAELVALSSEPTSSSSRSKAKSSGFDYSQSGNGRRRSGPKGLRGAKKSYTRKTNSFESEIPGRGVSKKKSSRGATRRGGAGFSLSTSFDGRRGGGKSEKRGGRGGMSSIATMPL